MALREPLWRKSPISHLFRFLLLFFGVLSPWIMWTLVHTDYSNVWDQVRRGLTGSSGRDSPKYCYRESDSIIVFLHVTNQSSEWLPLEACAFKLAAVHNNETGVCVLTAFQMEPHPLLAPIKNLEIAQLNYTLLFEDTPLTGWFEKYMLARKKSHIWMWELSDALRYTYLYKYGGKYMDTDSWTLRNLEPLNNVAGWQDGGLVANGVLFFKKHHPLIESIMLNFSRFFSSGSWGSSGPYLMTRIHRSGQVDNSTYTLVQPHVFYPTHYSQNHFPFIPSHNNAVKGMIKGSYALHLWRYMIQKYWNASVPLPQGSFVAEVLNTTCSWDSQTDLWA